MSFSVSFSSNSKKSYEKIWIEAPFGVPGTSRRSVPTLTGEGINTHTHMFPTSKVNKYFHHNRRYSALWAPTSRSWQGLVAFSHLKAPLYTLILILISTFIVFCEVKAGQCLEWILCYSVCIQSYRFEFAKSSSWLWAVTCLSMNSSHQKEPPKQ